MSCFSRAEHLLRNSGLARLIQIASIVKQAISADEVFIMRPIPSSGSAVPILWRDLIRGNKNNSARTVSTRRDTILSHDELVALSTLHEVIEHLDVDYFQDGYLWPQAEVDDGDVQALRLQYLIEGQGYLLVWARGHTRLFIESDRKLFLSLCETIAIGDEDSAYEPATHFDSNVQGVALESASVDLTPMEDKVFQLLKRGLTEKAVAQRLHRSPHTVHSHVRIIYRKFAVNSKKELIEKVVSENGIRLLKTM